MKFIKHFLFISILVNYVLSESTNENNDESSNEEEYDKKIFEGIESITIRREIEFKSAMEIIDQPMLLFHYRKSSKKSREAVGYLRECAEKLNHIVTILMVDCDILIPDPNATTPYSKCLRNEYSDGFPKISLLVPPEQRFDVYTRTVFMHTEIPWPNKDITESNLYNFAINDYPTKSIKLNANNLDNFIK